MEFEQWWQIRQVTDRQGNVRCRHPILLRHDVYAYGLHVEHYDVKKTYLVWEVCRNWGDHVVWDEFNTSPLERIEETEAGISAYTKNSVYHFVRVDPPELPEEYPTKEEWIEAQIAEQEAETTAEPVKIEVSMLGKLLIQRKYLKSMRFASKDKILHQMHQYRSRILSTTFSMIDLMEEENDPEAFRETLVDTLTDYAVDFRDAYGKDPERELYETFFHYATLLLCHTKMPDGGFDDVISLGEAFMRNPNTFQIVLEDNLNLPDAAAHVAAFEEWINDIDFYVPRDFDEYVLAAVAAFVGALVEPSEFEIGGENIENS